MATNMTVPDTFDPLAGDIKDRLGSVPRAATVGDVTINPNPSPMSRPAVFRTAESANFMPPVKGKAHTSALAAVTNCAGGSNLLNLYEIADV